MHLHAAAAVAGAHSQATSRRPRKPRSGRPTISRASSSRSRRRASGRPTTISSAASPGPTALNENVIYPSDGFGSAEGRDRRRLLRRLDQPGQPADIRRAVAMRSAARQPGFDRGAASRPFASAGKGVSVAWGLVPYSEGVGAMWPTDLGGQRRPRPAALCGAAQARRTDRLRRRASELSADRGRKARRCRRTRR